VATEWTKGPHHLFVGFLLAAMALLFIWLFAWSFVRNVAADGVTLYEAVVILAAGTFVFTICGIFLVVGVVLATMTRRILTDQQHGNYLDTYRVFGIEMAARHVVIKNRLGRGSNNNGPPGLPGSLCGFVHGLGNTYACSPGSPAGHLRPGLWQKVVTASATANHSLAFALSGAMRSLWNQGCLEYARATVSLRAWGMNLVETQCADRFYLFTTGCRPIGTLETRLWERIAGWRHQIGFSSEDIAPTVPSLLESFTDVDGDFKAFALRKRVLQEGLARGILHEPQEQEWSERLLNQPTVDPAHAERVAANWLELTSGYAKFEARHPEISKELDETIKRLVYQMTGLSPDPMAATRKILIHRLALALITLGGFMAVVCLLIAVWSP
jgi:hypothetical protein